MTWREQTQLIWHPDQVENHYEQPVNAFCYFRKTFELDAQPDHARVLLFADSRYKLFVNGTYAGRGPCRSDPREQYVDEWDITAHMRRGNNVIAVLALYYGYGTGQSISRIPALAVEAAMVLPGGEPFYVHSDSSWKCLAADAWLRNAPRINGCQGPIEIVDMGLIPVNWAAADYEETGWAQAKGRGSRLSPFWNWVVRDIPLLEEEEIQAGSIVNTGVLTEMPQPPERLHHQIHAEQPILQEASPCCQTLTGEYTVPTSLPGQASVITFNFAEMAAGYLQLEVTGSKGDILDVIYAEELWEGQALLNMNNNRPVERYILAEGRNVLEPAFAWRAFRYAQLRVRNHRGPVIIHRVGLRTRRYPLAHTATLQCSDRRLAGIWDISARTLRLCMQDGFLDSSSREQQQWMGDGRWQAVINYHYSGDSRLHRKLLRQVGQSQDWTGMTKARYPDGHHNYPPIPSFCLAWICSFRDYVRYTGDTGLVHEWWPQLLLAIRWFTAYENEHGLLENVPYWPFIDWGDGAGGTTLDVERGGIVTALNLQYLEGLQTIGEFAAWMKESEAEQLFSAKCAKLKAAVETWLWSGEEGAYADCLVGGALSGTISEPANALALLHLHAPEDGRAARIFHRVFSGQTGAPVVRGSPYFMLVIGRALSRTGRTRRALELIRNRYGAMLDVGATTTWERWNVFHQETDGTVAYSSASHAWGASPILFVFEGIFGLQPLAPGFQHFELAPAPCGLTDIAASLPTLYGEIRMALKQTEAGRYVLELHVPEGCTGHLYGQSLAAGTHTVIIEETDGVFRRVG
ncbi:MAG: hypothetical protein K0R57_773 [Paenibacillaceae bacterium]|jgi:hypothetical protein|nr:hypothetical protein [Paenibacillaceae bacterium]